MKLPGSFHRILTRLVFRVMGLRIDHWRQEVERLWSLDEKSRQEQLASNLASIRPKSASGGHVGSLDELRRAPVMSKEALSNLSSGVPNASKTYGRHTAGTTGDPTQIWLSKDELGRMLGVRDYCMSHYGLRLGDREARVWGRPQTGWRAVLKDRLMNRKVFHPVGQAGPCVVKDMLAYRPAYLYGYSSLLLEAARIIEQHQLAVPPLKAVICTAETILPSQKSYIGKQFRCPVAEEYGSTEFDIIASECPLGHRHLVNPWLWVETSEEGIVVSDVSRKTQPMVRYLLGDSIELEESDCGTLGSRTCFGAIEGRSINRFAFVSETEKFHAVEFARAMDNFFKNNDLQFPFCVEQNSMNRFRLRLPPDAPVDRAELQRHVKNEIKKQTGHRVIIECGALQSGKKTHYFINRMHDHNGS